MEKECMFSNPLICVSMLPSIIAIVYDTALVDLTRNILNIRPLCFLNNFTFKITIKLFLLIYF